MVDYLIVGSGIAGLYASMNIPKDKTALIITKKKPWVCNSYYAQGGVATAKNIEDVPAHINDTLFSGAGMCNVEAVTKMSHKSLETIEDLIHRGFEFDRNDAGELSYTKEAAHSTERILHADGDATGKMLHIFMSGATHVMIQDETSVTDLLVEDGVCYGVSIFHNGKNSNLYAKNIILASGGIGALYEYHTNATSAAGEIQGMAIEKNIELENMEMTQFHPTVFINKFTQKMLLSEALRGEGAYVVDSDGKRFLFEYDKRGELAPRSIVSRAIFDYKHKTGKKVYLSFETFTQEFFEHRFPNIYKNLVEFGYNLPRDRVRISPAFHYMMGGIKTDLNSKVLGFKNLYAIGEVASTGVHGANRLASNSLLEALVFAKEAVDESLRVGFEPMAKEFKVRDFELIKEGDKEIKNALRRLMSKNVGIIRNNADLSKTLEAIDGFLKKDIGRMLYLRLLTARRIAQSALSNDKSAGAHYKV